MSRKRVQTTQSRRPVLNFEARHALGTVRDLGRYFPMNEDRAEYYRRQAELCLEQAELAPDEPMRVRMRFIADEWLKMAARAALRTAA